VEKLSHDDDEAISRELKKYLLLNAFLAHIATHRYCTHKVAIVSQRSSIASLLLYCLCHFVANVVVVVLLLLPCTCRFGRRDGLAAMLLHMLVVLVGDRCLLPTSQHGALPS
jgi:hypothetical protein